MRDGVGVPLDVVRAKLTNLQEVLETHPWRTVKAQFIWLMLQLASGPSLAPYLRVTGAETKA